MLSWESIIREVDCGTYHLLANNDVDRVFFSMQFLFPHMQARYSECLYVAKASSLNGVTLLPDMSLFVLNDTDEVLNIPPEHVVNCVCCHDPMLFDGICERLSDLFGIQSGVLQRINRLVTHLHNNAGLQKIVDDIADLFQMPVSVMDSSFSYIAYSMNYRPVITFSEYKGIDTEISPADLKTLKKMGSLEKIESAKDTVWIEFAPDSCYYVPIFIDRVKIGYMTVYESPQQSTTALPKEYVIYLPMFASLLSLELQKNNMYVFNKASCFTYILSMILEKEHIDFNDIRGRLSAFQYELRPMLYLLFLELGTASTSDMKLASLTDSLRRLFRGSIYLIRDNAIVFLISRDEKNKVSGEELERWNDYLKGNFLHAGFTGSFEDFSQIKARYNETLLALNAGKKMSPSGGIYPFDKYQTDSMLELLPSNQTLRTFCYQPVMKLIEHDRIYSSKLVMTLREYIRHPKQTKIICDDLYIHKNTKTHCTTGWREFGILWDVILTARKKLCRSS